ncbi:MAG TPA: S41 family peptidase [Arenimonas sp.]|nr:S41 family peptidase [Arenimonas sp.]
MSKKHLFKGLAFALLSIASSAHARETPRVYVDGIAAAIEENYFDEARAKKIAADLRSAASTGKFDALQNARELSSELSTWLDPLDTHFDVSWAEPKPTSTAARDSTLPERVIPSNDPDKRKNYGVRNVEVLPGNIGYLDLRQFSGFEFGERDQPARQAVDAGLQLLSGTNALIIDLRENGGGAPQMVGYLSSAFVKKDSDIFNTFHGRGRTMSEAPLDWHPQPRLDTPLFILISGRTASAAEAFAYTMQSAKRAIIVGETSMGAANPGARVDAGNGFNVFVSFASPINPITKTNWEGLGVKPDVAVASATAPETARLLALQAVLAGGLQGDDATDARWALNALQAESKSAPPLHADDYVGSYGALVITEANGRLMLKNGRRPIRTLLSLNDDRFAIKEDPSQRVIFVRDANGKVEALESQTSSGGSDRYRRGG